MNKIAEILRINEQELEQHIPYKASWHQKYAHSAWVYIGGLPYELTEGDTICVMSQFGGKNVDFIIAMINLRLCHTHSTT